MNAEIATAKQRQNIWELCFDEVVIEKGMLTAPRSVSPRFT